MLKVKSAIPNLGLQVRTSGTGTVACALGPQAMKIVIPNGVREVW
jgi:hypothetical protein